MSSLFEVYDPHTFYMNLSLNWFTILLLVFIMFYTYWKTVNSYLFLLGLASSFLFSEFLAFFKIKLFKGLIFLFISLFMYLLFINLFGLAPYVFCVSSHLVFCLTFSLPFWLGVMIIGWFNVTNQMFSHLIPVGTPVFLISFMVLIEAVSQLIRPCSLAIRLMANMISGHLLMSLLGNWEPGSFLQGIVLLIQFGLFSFEFFVCFIQSYVFCALLVLYYGEV